MIGFDNDFFVPIMIFMIPIVAIIGGVSAGVVKMIGQQRLLELAQRERIAAIERGVDPAKLPPFPAQGGHDDIASMYMSPQHAARHRASHLMTGGLVTLAAGIGLGIMLGLITETSDKNVWSVGLIPGLVGVALIVSSRMVRRSADEPAGAPRA